MPDDLKPTAADWERVKKLRLAKWHELAGALWAEGWFDRYPHTDDQDSHLQIGFGFGKVPNRRAPLFVVMAGIGGFEVTLLRNRFAQRRAETAGEIVAALDGLVQELTDEEKGWLQCQTTT